MKRDSQRQRVYQWERLAVGPLLRPQLTEEACEQLIAQAIALYGKTFTVNAVKVRFTSTGKTAHYRWGTITLPRWARYTDTVLHEAAHAITSMQMLGARSCAAHDGAFVHVYCLLLLRVGGLQRNQMRQILKAAQKHKVDILPSIYSPRPLPERVQARKEQLSARKERLDKQYRARRYDYRNDLKGEAETIAHVEEQIQALLAPYKALGEQPCVCGCADYSHGRRYRCEHEDRITGVECDPDNVGGEQGCHNCHSCKRLRRKRVTKTMLHERHAALRADRAVSGTRRLATSRKTATRAAKAVVAA